MSKASRIIFRVVGSTAIGCALLGFFYNGGTLLVALGGKFEEVVSGDQPLFYQAFYTMSGICMLFYGILLWCGISFVRLETRYIWLFTITVGLEVIYFFGIGRLWMHPDIGLSVAGATGVANGGLMAQFLILFPLWGPIALFSSLRQGRPKKEDLHG